MIRYSSLARQDLLDIWSYIAAKNLAAADRVFDRIENTCRALKDFPQLGRIRPEVGDGARSIGVDRWLVFYRVLDGGVQVVRIVDGVRDLTRLEWPVE